jgi:hypothetical protein
MSKQFPEMSDAELETIMVSIQRKAAVLQEDAESKFRAECLQLLSIKHGMGPDDALKWAARTWWNVFGLRAKALVDPVQEETA